MLFAIIFLLCFVGLGVFALWLSKNVEHGEARFDTTKKAPDKRASNEQAKDDE